MSENDAPYSASWESYSLEGFDGGTFNKEVWRLVGLKFSLIFDRSARVVSAF